MEIVRLVAALVALCLFCSFLKHTFLLALRIPMILLFGHGQKSSREVDPDKVNLDEIDSLPILDTTEMPSYWA